MNIDATNQFVMTSDKYKSGIQLDEYNDRFSLVQAYKSKEDGKIIQKWCFPQVKDKKPSDKSLPWKIDLGTRDEAIEILKEMLGFLGAALPGPERLPAASGDFDPGDPSEIPF